MLIFAYILFILSFIILLYHHVAYPLLLTFFSRNRDVAPCGTESSFNSFTFVIPMHNEAHFIAKKIANLAALDYPNDRYQVLLFDDGSTDDSLQLASIASKKHPQLRISIISSPSNIGKVAALNQMASSVPDDHILFFSDVSATLSTNVLKRANQYFNNPAVGAYCPKYHLKKEALTGEKAYWDYQTAIKQKESQLGCPMGFHGSGYAIRKVSWRTLRPDTINDDFVIPLQVMDSGFVGVYDAKSEAVENGQSSEHIDWHRRQRISAGNIQQAYLLASLLSPKQGFIAWMFFSGKVLRTIMPWLLIFMWCTSFYIAIKGSALFACVWWMQNVFYLSVLFNVFYKTRLTEMISYFVIGHVASFLGWFYLFQLKREGQWRRSDGSKKKYYIHPIVFIGKWIIDKVSAVIGIAVFVILLPFIAIAIKLSSPGPVLYRQLRVGQTTDTHTQFFFLWKFRTMRINVKSKKNLWTEVNDPRMYPLGRLLRKTHLDELPQFMNILRGEMSFIGPRPERLSLFPYITKEIPFYEERLHWVKPGLTGLAQVTYRYDTTIEDLKKKLAYDHAYGIYLTNPLIWFKTDMKIMLKTVSLVLLGKGF